MRVQVKHATVKLKSGLSYPRQLCLEVGFVLTDSVSADKSFPDLIFLTFHARNSYLCKLIPNSYVTKYLPITVDNKTQKGLPFNHVIKCGTKFFGLISRHQQKQQRGRARLESPTSWGNYLNLIVIINLFFSVTLALGPKTKRQTFILICKLSSRPQLGSKLQPRLHFEVLSQMLSEKFSHLANPCSTTLYNAQKHST